MRRPSTRSLYVGGLLVALLLAGVVSVYASGAPDGLVRVADDKGFLGTAEEHPAGQGPFANYEVGDGGGTGLAGLVGVVAVVVLMTGVTYALRRRAPR